MGEIVTYYWLIYIIHVKISKLTVLVYTRGVCAGM